MAAKTARQLAEAAKTYTLADALADAGERVRRATRERDELIAAAAAEREMSQRAIAAAVGLSHTAVQVIVRRSSAAS